MLTNNKFLRIIANKYVLTLIVFMVWMSFIDARDWQLISSRHEKLKELEKSEEQLKKQIADTRKELNLLKSSAESIEKYAREKYMMKKDNEDLFIVKTP